MTRLAARLAGAAAAARAFYEDVQRVTQVARARGSRHPRLVAAADTSVWVLGLLRFGSGTRALVGSALGTRMLLRVVFHVDVWTDAIGPGLRLPHPFGIVIGDGVSIGRGCTLLHHVTVQRGATLVGDAVTLANQVTVLAGSHVGTGALIGAHAVVRGDVPAHTVAVGTPARVIRTRERLDAPHAVSSRVIA